MKAAVLVLTLAVGMVSLTSFRSEENQPPKAAVSLQGRMVYVPTLFPDGSTRFHLI
ncbi:MAG: hypothetical protein HY717_10350 [Planctomycetes bacterium]|nr:hypothetical protein [Planctomycetota bacterium]